MKFKIGNFQWTSRAEHTRLAALMLVALVALVTGVLLVVRIVRMPAPQARRAQAGAAASLNLVPLDAGQRDRILSEEARLFDPAPLFLPTRYNASQIDETTIARHEPGESLPLFKPGFVFSDGTFSIAFHDPYPGPAQPVDVLDYGITQTPYAPFGRAGHPEKPLAARMAQVEIIQVKTGRTLLTLPLAPVSAPAALPDALAAGWNPLELDPLEFFVELDVAGLVGSPALVQSSRSTAVDDFFANYLVQNLRIGAHRELGAGFYLLRIGP